MQILTGTKREITMMEWAESLRRQIDNLNNHLKCFEAYHDEDSIDWIIEDLPKLSKTAETVKQVIAYCDENGIK